MSGCYLPPPPKNNASHELYNCRCDELQKQIDALTEMCKEISLKHIRLIDFEKNKKPYKCPVCNGIQAVSEDSQTFILCRPCKGKGIVWG